MSGIGGLWAALAVAVWGVGTNALASPSPRPELAGCVGVRSATGSGAGCVLDGRRRWIVTCWHVVGESRRVEVVFPWWSEGRLIAEREAYLRYRAELERQGLWQTGTVRRTWPDYDLALVELERLPAGAAAVRPAVGLPRPGEMLRAVGHRIDLSTLWNVSAGPARASGRSNQGYFAVGRKLAGDAPIILAQLPIDSGDSGGPVFNRQGEWVGLAAAVRRSAEPAALLIPADTVLQAVRCVDPSRPEDPPAASPTPRPADPPVTSPTPQPADSPAVRPAGSPPAPPPSGSAGPPPAPPPPQLAAGDSVAVAAQLVQATVWVRPHLTERAQAGIVLDARHVLTVLDPAWKPHMRLGVVWPLRQRHAWLHERDIYRDRLRLHQAGLWRTATLAATDPLRQLALLRLDGPAPACSPLRLAQRRPEPGERLHVMNHPAGVELAWLYGQGVVRQHGRLRWGSATVSVLLAQLPGVAASPGGPVCNDAGELVGLWLDRDGPAQVGYVLDGAEVRRFLHAAGVDGQWPLSAEAVRMRLGLWYGQTSRRIAAALAAQGWAAWRRHERDAAAALAEAALRWDKGCGRARRLRLQWLDGPAAAAELDAALEYGPPEPELLWERIRHGIDRRDWRLVRSDLERLLELQPAEAAAYRHLVRVWLELGENGKAAEAVRDALRADPRQRAAVAEELRRCAQVLADKYPQRLSIAADWLTAMLLASNVPAWQDAAHAASSIPDGAGRLRRLLETLTQQSPGDGPR